MTKKLLGLWLLSFGLCATVVHASPAGDALNRYFADAFAERLKDEPESATAVGRHDYDDRWTDWSRAGRATRHAHSEARLRGLNALSRDGLSGDEELSLRLMRYQLEQELAAEDIETHLLRVGQLFGLHTRVYLTLDRMPSRDAKDYQNLLARLHGVPAYVDQNISILEEATAKGLTQPKVVLDLEVEQLNRQLAQGPEESALLTAFRHFPAAMPAAEQAALRTAAVASYQAEFQPAWRRLRDYLDGPYRAKARAQVGLSTLAGGRDAYAVLVRKLTTTNLQPEEIHRIGLEEVARLEAAMQQAMQETGFKGSFAEFNAYLEQSPEQHFSSKDDMLAYCRDIAKQIEPELPNLFKRMPILIYGVRAIPADREQATASNAQAPTADGSTPGWFNLNTYQPEKQVRYDKQALVLHEAVPGHVFQGAVARSMTNLPEFRKYYGNSAYAEGWALYAESLGRDLGIYKDPYSRYGQLASERFRAVRLVVDTGMHALGWSRERALEYFKLHAPEASVAEIDRYISWPGQALSYKLGQLEIRRLRDQAEAALGPRFDVREFHDVVLRGGVLPLELLHEQVEQYIRTAR